jgi:hypothetical protein
VVAFVICPDVSDGVCEDGRGGGAASVRLAVLLRSASVDCRVAMSVVFGRGAVGAVAFAPKADIMSDQTAPRLGFEAGVETGDAFDRTGCEEATMVRGVLQSRTPSAINSVPRMILNCRVSGPSRARTAAG